MRPTLYGNRHAVSAGHYLAAAAGNEILEAGGNAIDAGCAAGMALAVLHADEVCFSGVAPIIIRNASGEVVTISPYNYYPGCVSLEGRIGEAVQKDLAARGHRIEVYPDCTGNVAAVEVIVAEPKPGFIRAGADPRQPAYAIVH